MAGNDLVARSYPYTVMVAIDIQRLAVRLLGVGVRRVIVCRLSVAKITVVEFFGWGVVGCPSYQYRGVFCDDSDGISFWRHKCLWGLSHTVDRGSCGDSVTFVAVTTGDDDTVRL